MRIFRNSQSPGDGETEAVAAIGNFDGLHLGHESVIRLAQEIARKEGRPSGIVTFEPHPREFFAPEAAPFRLMGSESRIARLRELDVDLLFEMTFNSALASLSAEDFADSVLRQKLHLAHVVVGSDFRYGHRRCGSVETLAASGRLCGFEVTVAPELSDRNGKCSSSAIRKALAEGRMRDASRMLGRRYSIEGRVEKGDQRGRHLGFPTLNISIAGLHPPKFGVYAALANVRTGPFAGRYRGSASIGIRPTFGESTPLLEIFLFDFSNCLYGELVSVELVEFQREELKFKSADELVDQMKNDCERTLDILESAGATN
ncbi:MAG: bifunctional riboflavin kinase/FAD synthetase [Albidovulum sp.]|nr:bifunctional riboflavin kinase/FAD synthetase [Albidovulum sp.]